ncbi:MAG: hypothetical protein QXP98_05880 [Thermoproteus sp.]
MLASGASVKYISRREIRHMADCKEEKRRVAVIRFVEFGVF